MRERLAELIASLYPGSRLTGVERIGADEAEAGEATEKGAGYGLVYKLAVDDPRGRRRKLVFHTAAANEFDHDRRSDRAKSILLAFDTYDRIPRHVPAADVGAVLADGRLQSLRDAGELYLLTEFAEGDVYANDLRRIGSDGRSTPDDLGRAETLARYLADLHADKPRNPTAYTRSIRNLIGDGEGVFGLIDSFSPDDEVATPSRLQAIEAACVAYRWKLQGFERRGARLHGDFHPFNILFDDDSTLALLDASRGCYGDPADDVICLAINYVFFALERPAGWSAGLRPLWERFWKTYLDATGDGEILEVIPPFLAWRLLVLANPKWYPATSPSDRDALLRLAEKALEKGRFDLEDAEEIFA